MTRLSEKLAILNSRHEGALIGYVVAGYPDYDGTFDVVQALVEGGVDIIELGIPFSDPIADGPTIQKASYRALQNGITPYGALNIAKKISDNLKVPLTIMTYYNILYRPGFDSYLKVVKSSGIDGLIIPDLSVDESTELKKYTTKYDLDTIFLVSPNSSDKRLKAIVKGTSGFLYLVSVFGTTGERKSFEEYTSKAIRHVKTFSKGRVPLAVGFGVSKPEHVKFMLDSGADAIIVGSAFINAIDETEGQEKISRLEALARSLKDAAK